MSDLSSYDVAVVRIVPRVEREEFLNTGVILFCRSHRFLESRLTLDRGRLAAIAPWLSAEEVNRHLSLIPLVCAGGASAGALGLLSQQERFHWLTTPRSTVIQTGPVHSGLCDDPRTVIERLLVLMTGSAPPSPPPAG